MQIRSVITVDKIPTTYLMCIEQTQHAPAFLEAITYLEQTNHLRRHATVRRQPTSRGTLHVSDDQ